MIENYSKTKSLTLVSFSYLLAVIIGYLVVYFLKNDYSVLWLSLYGDVAATIVIFAFSVRYSNSSFYDAYWSVIPIIIVLHWFVYFNNGFSDLRNVAILLLVGWWGIRLTWNWILRWEGMMDEDFRYVDLKKKTGSFYWIVSFLGIHMLPTFMVFLGLIPVLISMENNTNELNIFDLAALIVTAGAIIIETVADNQLRTFKRNNKDKTKRLNSGIWKYIKYPNYFGENLFWWGLFVFAIGANFDNW